MGDDCVERKFDMTEYGILHNLIKNEIQNITSGILHSQKILKEIASKEGKKIHTVNECLRIEASNKAGIMKNEAEIKID